MEDAKKAPARKRAVMELFGEDSGDTYSKVPWREGIVANIRAVPADVDRQLRRKFTGNIKAKQLGEQSAEKVIDRGEDLTAERAVYALGSFEGYVFTTRSKEIADAMGAALSTPVLPGTEVDLDGKWSDEVKAVVFRYAPKCAAWVSNEADKLSRQDAAAEEETAGN